MKHEYFVRIFEKYSNIKFHDNPPSGNQVVKRGQGDGLTDMARLRVAVYNFCERT